jgi:hypothetical protein
MVRSEPAELMVRWVQVELMARSAQERLTVLWELVA